MPGLASLYEEIALQDPSGGWELAPCIGLRKKPLMTQEHNSDMSTLAMLLMNQLDWSNYRVSQNGPPLRLSDGVHYFIPDVCVIPRSPRERSSFPQGLEVVEHPVPFVAEVWSPSTGDYDVESKFDEHRKRGDLEIWRVHPYELTVTAWRRQGDGSYTTTSYSSGAVPVESLPGVVVPLDTLFS